MYTVHRLVAKYFCYGQSEINCVVNHKDGDSFNNRSDNLEWCTSKDNTIHAHQMGLAKGVAGEQNSGAKLSNIQIFDILTKFYVCLMNKKDIASELNLNPDYVALIVRGRRWKVQYNEFKQNYLLI
jgi:hypothetical protein